MKTHILLVDDDIDEMKTFVEALKKVVPPFKCTYAANGIHALKMLGYLRPEVIFVDYNMPAMNGLEVIAEIKRHESLGGIPVFLYARHISRAILEKAMKLGIAGCMDKPASTEGLVTALKSVFAIS